MPPEVQGSLSAFQASAAKLGRMGVHLGALLGLGMLLLACAHGAASPSIVPASPAGGSSTIASSASNTSAGAAGSGAAGASTAVASSAAPASRVAERTAGGASGQAGADGAAGGATAPSAGTGSAGRVPRTDEAGTVWLCRPGIADNPCDRNLNYTVVNGDGSRVAKQAQAAANPAIDCFYVYPTVSTEKTPNADLEIQPEETMVATAQASRFSQVCNVWAPMYRQGTLNTLSQDGAGRSVQEELVAYQSLLPAWQDYVEHYNNGRPVVFIGHSQGAAMLSLLLKMEVDPNATLRKQLVSAILLGANVAVPAGGTVGSTFQNIPTCQSNQQTGCVVAYSSYLEQPPANALFGRPGQGVSLLTAQSRATGLQVVCTNPAGLDSGTGTLDPFDLTPTGWVEYPNLYSAHCTTAGGATWLQVTDIGGANDKRPRVKETLGPTWGLHLEDVNLALGNLVQLAGDEAAAYSTP
ncbi:MAG: DUF3089 domain-containing protein [Chloroflexi bacterium]|nr:DUF3089 domain-containing protein [Chloroflexota bacterium]